MDAAPQNNLWAGRGFVAGFRSGGKSSHIAAPARARPLEGGGRRWAGGAAWHGRAPGQALQRGRWGGARNQPRLVHIATLLLLGPHLFSTASRC